VVRNALDAMHGRDGRVLSINSEVRDGDIRITVRDNGHGISPEDRSKSFCRSIRPRRWSGRSRVLSPPDGFGAIHGAEAVGPLWCAI